MQREKNNNKEKKKTRIIVTNIQDKDYFKKNLLYFLSSQLSDGYWENEPNFYEEYWNWLKFDVQKGSLVIKISSKPIWSGVADIFFDKTDEEVVRYIGEVLENCYDLCFSIFERFDYTQEDIENFINELKNFSSDKCFTAKENDFVKELDGMHITYMQFLKINAMWNNLTKNEQEKIDKVLGVYEKELGKL